MTLTEDWKTGTLKYGWYFVNDPKIGVVPDQYMPEDTWLVSNGFSITEVLAPCDYEELQQLQKKVERAIGGINGACAWLTCMDDLSRFNNGKCNEQMALEMLNKTMEKIK